MTTQSDIDNWLHEAIRAAKTERQNEAHTLLLDVVDHDPLNEVAWFWLYNVSDKHDDRRTCLENLIVINPSNEWAKQELAIYFPTVQTAANYYHSAPNPSKDSQDRLTRSTRRIVMAFWAGSGFILLVISLVTTVEWLISGLRSRTIPNGLNLAQLIELMGILTLVGVAAMSLIVTVGLFRKSNVGFYGSLLLALLMLFLGPIISLLVPTPNYLIAVCTSGTSAVIMLLTLASLNEFNH